MKVLITATVQSHIAQFHLPLIELLKQYGHEVHVAARNNLIEKNGLKLESPDKIYDIPFERSPLSKQNIKAYKQLKKIIINNNYDIIHCNTPMGGVITRLAAKEVRKRGTEVYYTAHGFHFYIGAPIKNWLLYYPIEKWLSKYTDKLITVTKEDYKLASLKFKTNVHHIHGVGANSKKYFPYPIDIKEKLKKELGYSSNQFMLLCTGELNDNKNQSTVIKAVGEVAKEIPNIKLLLAGNGPNEQQLRNLVENLNITKHVEFLGYRTDLEKYVNISDVIISASFREGLPLNIMEAMLCGKPVIASSNRGHKELIQHGKTGYLITADKVDEYVRYIFDFINNRNLINTLGRNGREAIQPFTSDNVVDELEEIYNIKKSLY